MFEDSNFYVTILNVCDIIKMILDFRRFSQNIVLRSLGEYSSEKDFRFLFQRETERQDLLIRQLF